MLTIEMDNFDLGQICRSGQCFRMDQIGDDRYRVIAGDNKLQKNKRFKVEIIDVWAMTVTEYPVIFETTEELDYRVFDIHHRGVRIPDAPYIVLRITEVK